MALQLIGLLAWAARPASADPWDLSLRTCPVRIPAPLQHHGRFGCPAPLDDGDDRSSKQQQQQQPLRWSPWSHAPTCAHATLLEPGEAGYGARKYCVYTNARHGMGGMSLVALPEVAAESIELWDEEVPDGARQTEPAYEVVDLPGKGKGVVATRRIAQYEAFMVDYAALVVDLFFPVEVDRRAGYGLLRMAAEQLSRPQSARVYGLAQTSSAAQDAVENVLRSNAFHTMLGSRPHMALYPEVSRINHACMPNAFPRFRPRSMAVTVAATRDIQPGEEITISYITVGQTYADRQKALEHWAFQCTCALCAAPRQERDESDERRLHIARLRDAATAAFQGGDAAEALRLTRAGLARMEEEHMFPLYSEQYENMGRIYSVMGEARLARAYAQKSLDVLAQQGFISDEQARRVDLLLADFERGGGGGDAREAPREAPEKAPSEEGKGG